MHKIFISYSRFDYTNVVKFTDELEQVLGKKSCWIDLAGIESDQQFVDVIIDAIDKAEVFLFMYSKHSDNSEWTRKEIEYAYSEKKRIVFVKMENIQLSKYFRFQFGGHDIIDLNDEKQKEKLKSNLAKWCGREKYSQIKWHSEKKDILTSSMEWNRSYYVEILLFISAFLVIFLFLVCFPLFIVVNYKYRSCLKAKYPQYWNIILKSRDILCKVFVGVSIVLPICFVFWAYSDYDNSGLVAAWILFLASVSFTIYCRRVSYFCCFKTQRTAIVIFGVSAFLYLCSICFFYYNRSVLDSYMELTPLSEQQDTITSLANSVMKAESKIGTINTNRGDSLNVSEGTSMESYCLHGDFDEIESKMQVTVKSWLIEGHIEETAIHSEMFLSMHLNKRAISGIVENIDGVNIGYIEGLCEIKDSILSIKGKIVQRDLDDEDYNFKTHKFSYMGIVPSSFLNELQIR